MIARPSCRPGYNIPDIPLAFDTFCQPNLARQKIFKTHTIMPSPTIPRPGTSPFPHSHPIPEFQNLKMRTPKTSKNQKGWRPGRYYPPYKSWARTRGKVGGWSSESNPSQPPYIPKSSITFGRPKTKLTHHARLGMASLTYIPTFGLSFEPTLSPFLTFTPSRASSPSGYDLESDYGLKFWSSFKFTSGNVRVACCAHDVK